MTIFSQLSAKGEAVVGKIKLCCFDQANKSMSVDKVNDMVFKMKQVVAMTPVWTKKLYENQQLLNATPVKSKQLMSPHLKHIAFKTATNEQKIKVFLAVARKFGCIGKYFDAILFSKTYFNLHYTKFDFNNNTFQNLIYL